MSSFIELICSDHNLTFTVKCSCSLNFPMLFLKGHQEIDIKNEKLFLKGLRIFKHLYHVKQVVFKYISHVKVNSHIKKHSYILFETLARYGQFYFF